MNVDTTVDTNRPSICLLPTYEIYQLEYLISIKKNLDENVVKYMTIIKENNLINHYLESCKNFNWTIDDVLLNSMKKANEETYEQLNSNSAKINEKYGELEIKEAKIAIANFYLKSGQHEKAEELLMNIIDFKHVESVLKVNIYLSLARIYLFRKMRSKTFENLNLAEQQFKLGGDWETKNRLVVYKALYLYIFERDLKTASDLLISALSTFNAYEILSYNHFIRLTIYLSILVLSRKDLVEKISKSSQVLEALSEMPHLAQLYNSIIECNYSEFFSSLLTNCQYIKECVYMNIHYAHFLRNVRVRIYEQYLKPFKCVSISAMAETFGVSEKFLTDDIVLFIANYKLFYQVDQIENIIFGTEVISYDKIKNDFIITTNILMDRIEVLSRVIDL